MPVVATGQGGSKEPEQVAAGQLATSSAAGFETPRQRAIEEREPVEPRGALWRDLEDELRWNYAGRKSWLLQIIGNGATAVVFLIYSNYDPHVAGDIKHANVGLQVVLYSLASQLNTNQLGYDGERVFNSLKAGDRVWRILAIKNVALLLILYPFALAVTLIHETIADRYQLFLQSAVFDLGAVLLWLGVGSVVSVVLSYPPISVVRVVRKWPPKIKPGPRIWAILARRRIIRYALAMAAPYALYGGIVVVLHLPWHAIWDNSVLGPRRVDLHTYELVYLGISLGYWLLGLWLAGIYDRRYPQRVMRDLQQDV
jgi:hypothetical protein